MLASAASGTNDFSAAVGARGASALGLRHDDQTEVTCEPIHRNAGLLARMYPNSTWQMFNLTARLDRAWYPEFNDNWDDWLFRERILRRLQPYSLILDLGAGAGNLAQMNFRGLAAQVCGVDVDPRVINNPLLDDGRVANAQHIPYEAARFDIVFANNVLEHLIDPSIVFREVARVLKPGGVFMFKTPNRHHYMPVVAQVTPHRFHQYVNRLRGRAEVDTFPTVFRANTRAEVTKLAWQSGLTVEQIEHIEGRPEYLRVAWPSYLLGALYERIVNTSEIFATFRILLIATLRR
jgi:SAM-dependent methyltransferase